MSLRARIDKIEQRLNNPSNIKFPTFSQFFCAGKRMTWDEWMRANNKPSKALDDIISTHNSFSNLYEEV